MRVRARAEAKLDELRAFLADDHNDHGLRLLNEWRDLEVLLNG